MVSLVATPACYIDIYPFEGGVYTLSGDNANLLGRAGMKASVDSFGAGFKDAGCAQDARFSEMLEEAA